jgi:diguanylate cyclase (GGDEF)-like protein
VRLLRSLRSRIFAFAALFCVAALSLGVLLFQTSAQSRDAVRLVSHTQEVISNLNALLGNLREGESSLRGYILTHQPDYLKPVDQDLQRAGQLVIDIRRMVTDNPQQEARAAKLQTLVDLRVTTLHGILDLSRRLPAREITLARLAPDPVRVARAKQVMDQILATTAAMQKAERTLLAERTAIVEDNAEHARLILFLGWPILAAMILTAVWMILVSITRPLTDLLDVVTRFGAGDRTARATAGRSVEFQGLATAYNQMADKLVEAMEKQAGAEREIARANAELVERGRALESRNQSIALVSEMAQRLQAIRSEQELAEVLACFLPQAMPGAAGSLYILNSSRNLLARTVSWGEPQAQPETITPDACWALRRGKEHLVREQGNDMVCTHARCVIPVERRCEPVLAGGDVLGLLYVEGTMADEAHFMLGLLTENIALALVNEALRKRLREQSIRDPLTGLFNRRYMEEALALETARALRGHGPLAVVMTDVDHFKPFNDRHGHEAGDALLRAVGRLIQSEFRDGDIVCRYGGEEFIIIAPGATLGMICERAEALRLAVSELTVDFRGQRIGPVTMSFGIGSWNDGKLGRPEDLLARADQALYRAKRLGRDRIETAASETLVAAE